MSCFSFLCPPKDVPKANPVESAASKSPVAGLATPGVLNHVALLAAGHGKPPDPRNREGYRSRSAEIIPADIRIFAGHEDAQAPGSNPASFSLPANAGPGGSAGGCTMALLQALERNSHTSWKDLLADMSVIMKTMKYTQAPQLSTTKEFSLSMPFSMKKGAQSRTKALFIGINYVGQNPGELRGCHKDVDKMKRYVTSQGYDPEKMKVLLDDNQNTRPTKAEILAGLKWLLQGTSDGDSLFLHYSGHGGRLIGDSNDENDSFEQTLVPVDWETAGHITDDQFLQELVIPLPVGVMLTIVIDCCHTGNIVDLPYSFTASQENMQAVTNGTPIALRPNLEFKYRKYVKAAVRITHALKQGGDGKRV